LDLDGIKRVETHGLNAGIIKAALHQATNKSISLEGDLACDRPLLKTLAEHGLQMVNWPGHSPNGPRDYPAGKGMRPYNRTNENPGNL
ncbi:hypothetical protein FRB98_002196, partial [Tulasnella sp. 332]